MRSSNSPKPPDLLAVQLRPIGRAGDDLVVALRYAYSGKPPSERQRARMVRDLLHKALAALDRGAASVAFTGFREDALQHLRTAEFHIDGSHR